MTPDGGEGAAGAAAVPLGPGRAALGLRATLGAFADLLLPPVCISCRRRVESHGLLCGDCWGKIEFIAPPICARLGVPLPYEMPEPCLSAAAIANPPRYDRARAVARYSATMRDLIHSFKYGDRHEGLPLFGRWLAGAGAELLGDADLIVPVPLYRARPWSRRFNQSALLAREVGKLSGVPVDCFLLARVKRTETQVGFTAAQRRKNVSGAFRVARGRASLRGKRMLLIDDVITTGATAEACARTLQRAGAASVDVLALARAVGPGAVLQ